MIFHDIPQQTNEWFKARRGIGTTSCFDQIITPAKGEMSKSAQGYVDKLVGELVTGENAEKFESYWMERGALMEADAAASYEIITGLYLEAGGFVTNDDMTLGASPDCRVIDKNTGQVIGGAEIKCPMPATHIANLRRAHVHGAIDPQYIPQVQGQILIGGFEFVDWFSYHPDFPPAHIRTYRDDEYCDKLEANLDIFLGMMDDTKKMLTSMGTIIPEQPIIDMHKRALKAAADAAKPKGDYMMAG